MSPLYCGLGIGSRSAEIGNARSGRFRRDTRLLQLLCAARSASELPRRHGESGIHLVGDMAWRSAMVSHSVTVRGERRMDTTELGEDGNTPREKVESADQSESFIRHLHRCSICGVGQERSSLFGLVGDALQDAGDDRETELWLFSSFDRRCTGAAWRQAEETQELFFVDRCRR